MIFVDHRIIFEEKIKRQKSIPQLEYHAGGACIHIGKISPGCRHCFTQEDGGGIQIGQNCQFKCPMCYYSRDRKDDTRELDSIKKKLSDYFYMSFKETYKPVALSLQSSGETLNYLNDLEMFMLIINKLKADRGINTYHHVYTNGVLCNEDNLKRLYDMGVHELRFHISASDFSKVVIENMYTAAKMGFFVSVEEPSWPKHKKKLIEHLPIFQDIGLKHLNLVEVQITKHNFNDIDKEYPKGRFYKDALIHLYDEGMVYDIIEEVIEKGYSYSVLDCNSWIERYRQLKTSKSVWFDMKLIDGMCAEWDYGDIKK